MELGRRPPAIRQTLLVAVHLPITEHQLADRTVFVFHTHSDTPPTPFKSLAGATHLPCDAFKPMLGRTLKVSANPYILPPPYPFWPAATVHAPSVAGRNLHSVMDEAACRTSSSS